MLLIFKLSVTLLVIGIIMHVIVKVIDLGWHGGRLDDSWYIFPDLIVCVSFLTLIGLAIVGLWRIGR